MKLFPSLVAVAMLTAIQPVEAATTDPQKLIYRVSGVTDNGSPPGLGSATAVHCTNFSPVTERITFVVQERGGSKAAVRTHEVESLRTFTAVTHSVAAFSIDVQFFPSGKVINQGSIVIFSTSLHFHCSAMIVDAAAQVPQGIALHMVRVHPAPNTQE